MSTDETIIYYFAIGPGRFASGKSVIETPTAGAVDLCERFFRPEDYPLAAIRVALCVDPSRFTSCESGAYRTRHCFAKDEVAHCVSVRAAIQSFDHAIEIEGANDQSLLKALAAEQQTSDLEFASDLVGSIDTIAVSQRYIHLFREQSFISKSDVIPGMIFRCRCRLLRTTFGELVKHADRIESWPMSMFRSPEEPDDIFQEFGITQLLTTQRDRGDLLQSRIRDGFVATVSLQDRSAEHLSTAVLMLAKSTARPPSPFVEAQLWVPSTNANKVYEMSKQSNAFMTALPRRNGLNVETILRSDDTPFCELSVVHLQNRTDRPH